jgi:hypothetical protein
VYGPFSWKKGCPFEIDRATWVDALPLIIKEGTSQGVLFCQGFGDKILVESGVSRYRIADAKKLTPSENDAFHIPVLYFNLCLQRRYERDRCVRVKSREKSDSHPRLWKDGGSNSVSSKKRGGNRAGALMALETRDMKNAQWNAHCKP